MQSYFKKFILALMTATLAAMPAYAEDEPITPEVEGDLSLARCIQQGNIDFTLFLNATIAQDGFTEALIEPWNDVLFRNQCHGADILSLLEQRNKVKSSIRDSFFTCQTDEVPKLKKAFTKLNMEIYYVRHVVDGNLVLSLPYDILSTRMAEDPEALFTDRNKLYTDMKKKYFDSEILTQDEFDQHFLFIEKKKMENKQTYVLCETSSWTQVQEKWEEFIDSAGGVGDAAEEFEEGVKRQEEKIVESANRASLDEYLGSIFAVSINNVDPQTGFDEIVGNLSEDYGDFGEYASPSITDVINTISVEEFRYNTDKLEADMRSKYTGLYKQGGDGAVQLFVDELVNLNEILKAAYKPIKVVESCAETMNSRQCPG